MNCRTFEQTVQSLMDRRVPLDCHEALADHCDHCPACAAKLEQFAQLEGIVDAIFAAPFAEQTALSAESSAIGFAYGEQLEWTSPSKTWWGGLQLSRSWANQLAAACLMVVVGLSVCVTIATKNGRNQSWISLSRVDPQFGARGVDTPNASAANVAGELAAIDLSGAWDGYVAELASDQESLAILRRCYRLTSEIPGVRTLECTVTTAWELLLRTIPASTGPPLPHSELPSNPHSGLGDRFGSSRFV